MQNGAHPSVRDLRVSPEILVMDGQGLALPGFARRALTYMHMRFIFFFYDAGTTTRLRYSSP